MNTITSTTNSIKPLNFYFSVWWAFQPSHATRTRGIRNPRNPQRDLLTSRELRKPSLPAWNVHSRQPRVYTGFLLCSGPVRWCTSGSSYLESRLYRAQTQTGGRCSLLLWASPRYGGTLAFEGWIQCLMCFEVQVLKLRGSSCFYEFRIK